MRRQLGFVVSIIIILLGMNKNVYAANLSGVDYHTIQEIISYMEDHKNAISFTTSYSNIPNTVAPYSLGKVSLDTQQKAVDLLNVIRYIAGIPYNVTIDNNYIEKAQAAALVNAANADGLSHYPIAPSGMMDDLYNLGYSGAGSSNLSAGRDLCKALKYGWMSDDGASNISRVGHRRWCLNPTMGKVGFGEVYNPSSKYGEYTAMYAFDRSNISANSYKNVAWPSQNMPTEFFAKNDPWSISLGQNVEGSTVKVVLTCVNTGKVYNFTMEESDGDFFVNNDSYGQKGCIIFRPFDGTFSVAGYSYNVRVTGNYTNGTIFDISYGVNFFDAFKTEIKAVNNEFPGKYEVNIENKGQVFDFSFVPAQNGEYTFYSSSDNNMDTVIRILTDTGALVGENDDAENQDTYQYKLTIRLNSNQKYIVRNSLYSGTGTFYMNVNYNSNIKRGWNYIDGYWYYYNDLGQLVTSQWINNIYYVKNDGKMATDEWVENGKYYVDANGRWVPNKQKYVEGWKKNNTGWWYQNADGTYPKDCFKEINGVTYYFNASGYMVTGWKLLDGYWYYFNPSGSLAVNKWIDNIYYVKSDGKMATNEWVENGKYYVDSNGVYVPGKKKDTATWKYNSVGYWYEYADGTYPTNCWKQIDGYWYYFNASGYRIIGWMQIGNDWYYFYADGKMASNTWVGDYYLDGSGQWIENKGIA